MLCVNFSCIYSSNDFITNNGDSDDISNPQCYINHSNFPKSNNQSCNYKKIQNSNLYVSRIGLSQYTSVNSIGEKSDGMYSFKHKDFRISEPSENVDLDNTDVDKIISNQIKKQEFQRSEEPRSLYEEINFKRYQSDDDPHENGMKRKQDRDNYETRTLLIKIPRTQDIGSKAFSRDEQEEFLTPEFGFFGLDPADTFLGIEIYSKSETDDIDNIFPDSFPTSSIENQNIYNENITQFIKGDISDHLSEEKSSNCTVSYKDPCQQQSIGELTDLSNPSSIDDNTFREIENFIDPLGRGNKNDTRSRCVSNKFSNHQYLRIWCLAKSRYSMTKDRTLFLFPEFFQTVCVQEKINLLSKYILSIFLNMNKNYKIYYTWWLLETKAESNNSKLQIYINNDVNYDYKSNSPTKRGSLLDNQQLKSLGSQKISVDTRYILVPFFFPMHSIEYLCNDKNSHVISKIDSEPCGWIYTLNDGDDTINSCRGHHISLSFIYIDNLHKKCS